MQYLCPVSIRINYANEILLMSMHGEPSDQTNVEKRISYQARNR